MKMTVNYRDVERHKPTEKDIEHGVDKLKKLLKSYSPDLVQLHAVFSKRTRTEEHELALNLILPNGTLHASAVQKHLRACCKHAFAEIESQLKKHQAKLRKDYEWKRKRPRARVAEAVS
jgi:ribosomal subunit interface protein